MIEIYQPDPEESAVSILTEGFVQEFGDLITNDLSAVLIHPEDDGSVSSLKFGCTLHKYDGHSIVSGPFAWQVAQFVPRIGTRTLTYTEEHGGPRFTEAHYDRQLVVRSMREADPTEVYENITQLLGGQAVRKSVADIRSARAIASQSIGDFAAQAKNGSVLVPFTAERVRYEYDDKGDVVVRKTTYPTEKLVAPHDKGAKEYIKGLEAVYGKKFFMATRFLEPVDGKIESIEVIEKRNQLAREQNEKMRIARISHA